MNTAKLEHGFRRISAGDPHYLGHGASDVPAFWLLLEASDRL